MKANKIYLLKFTKTVNVEDGDEFTHPIYNDLSNCLNADEQKIINNAIKRLERAKVELEDAENKPDTWWNNLWGRKSKIKDAETELKEAQNVRDAADNKAKAMFQQRIETADVQTLLNELSPHINHIQFMKTFKS